MSDPKVASTLKEISTGLKNLTRVMEALNQNFVAWASKDNPEATIEHRYVPVEGYAAGAPDHPARKLKAGE